MHDTQQVIIRELYAESSKIDDGIRCCIDKGHLERITTLKVVRFQDLASLSEGILPGRAGLLQTLEELLLDTVGSERLGGRFNTPGKLAALYAAQDAEAAGKEWEVSLQRARIQQREIVVQGLLQIKDLNRVLDLRRLDVLRELDINEERIMSENWVEENEQYGRETMTQAIGRLAFESGIQALVVPSAAMSTKMNVVILGNEVARKHVSIACV